MQQLLNVSSLVADWTQENQLAKAAAAKSRWSSQYDDDDGVKTHILLQTPDNRIVHFGNICQKDQSTYEKYKHIFCRPKKTTDHG